MAFYSGAGQEVRPTASGSLMSYFNLTIVSYVQQQLAQQVLTQFQENPEAWTKVPDILEHSTFPQAKVLQS